MPLPILSGEMRVATEPELRFTPGGHAVCNFTLVSNERKKEGDAWIDGDPCWLRATAWKKMAENCTETLKVGTLVFVSGELKTREYEHEGSKRMSVELTVREIGPSLKWDRAEVIKAERTATSQSSAPPASDPWPTAAASDEPPF